MARSLRSAALLAVALLIPAASAQTGTVHAWGKNQYGAATVPAGLTDVVQVDNRGEQSVALRSDGTVVVWGSASSGLTTVPAAATGIVHVDAGGRQIVAVRGDGTVVAWGRIGQAAVPAGLLARDVASGRDHVAAVLMDGTVVAWGQNLDGATAVPAGLDAVVQVDAGDRHTLALRADGTVVCWGQNTFHQCDVPAGLTDVVQVAAGWAYSLALKADGTVVGWGGYGDSFPAATPPAHLTDAVAISAGQLTSGALRADGTIEMWGTEGRDNTGELTVPTGIGPSAHLAVGNQVALAVGGVPCAPSRQACELPLQGTHAFVAGRELASPSGSHYLVFQTDGNLVVYTRGGQPVWGLNFMTPNWPSVTEVLFENGNLVAYAPGRQQVWKSSAFDPAATLHLSDDGKLEIRASDGRLLWTT